MSDHHFTISGERWLWRYSDLRGGADGWTDYASRKILIHKRLSGRRLLEVELHEAIHATLGPAIAEEAVTAAGKEISRILWALGYRNSQ